MLNPGTHARLKYLLEENAIQTTNGTCIPFRAKDKVNVAVVVVVVDDDAFPFFFLFSLNSRCLVPTCLPSGQ